MPHSGTLCATTCWHQRPGLLPAAPAVQQDRNQLCGWVVSCPARQGTPPQVPGRRSDVGGAPGSRWGLSVAGFKARVGPNENPGARALSALPGMDTETSSSGSGTVRSKPGHPSRSGRFHQVLGYIATARRGSPVASRSGSRKVTWASPAPRMQERGPRGGGCLLPRALRHPAAPRHTHGGLRQGSPEGLLWFGDDTSSVCLSETSPQRPAPVPGESCLWGRLGPSPSPRAETLPSLSRSPRRNRQL